MNSENNICAICKEPWADKELNKIDQINLWFINIIEWVKVKVHKTCFNDAVWFTNTYLKNQ